MIPRIRRLARGIGGHKRAPRRAAAGTWIGVTEIHPILVARDGVSYVYSYRRVTSSDLFIVHPPRYGPALAEGAHDLIAPQSCPCANRHGLGS